MGIVLISTFLDNCILPGGTSHPFPQNDSHIKYTVLLGTLVMRHEIWIFTELKSLDIFPVFWNAKGKRRLFILCYDSTLYWKVMGRVASTWR